MERTKCNKRGNTEEIQRCTYCGMICDTVDHVIPQKVIRMIAESGLDITDKLMRNRILKVPACRECNSLLSSNFFDTLADKKRYLKHKLRKRYKKILEIPPWNKTELDEMGPGMRGYIYQNLTLQKLIKMRIA